MVSKNSKGIFLLRFFFVCIISSSFLSSAQNISKYFTANLQENGILYFIEPEQVFKGEKRNELVYDLTYLTANDSIVFNFTFFTKEEIIIDGITLSQKNTNLLGTTSKIFIEYSKNKWKHRYTTKFLFNDLDVFFKSKIAPIILIHCNTKEINLSIKTNKWIKRSRIISKIFQLIKINN